MNFLQRAGLSIALKGKVRRWYCELLEMQESGIEWLYLSAEKPKDKLEICGFGKCNVTKTNLQKFKMGLKISDLPDAYNGVKELLIKEGYTIDFVDTLLKISCIISYKQNYVVIDDSRPCSKIFGSSDKVNEKDSICVRIYYYDKENLVDGKPKFTKKTINIDF